MAEKEEGGSPPREQATLSLGTSRQWRGAPPPNSPSPVRCLRARPSASPRGRHKMSALSWALSAISHPRAGRRWAPGEPDRMAPGRMHAAWPCLEANDPRAMASKRLPVCRGSRGQPGSPPGRRGPNTQPFPPASGCVPTPCPGAGDQPPMTGAVRLAHGPAAPEHRQCGHITRFPMGSRDTAEGQSRGQSRHLDQPARAGDA